MKVIKPGKIGVLSRCFEYQRKYFMGVSALLFVPMDELGQTLISEVGMWTFVAERLGKEAVLDASVPKSRAEFIVSGSAFTPGGEPQPHCAVRARVAGREKILYAFGDRYWRSNRVSEPQPFTRMPLDWAHAYGGPSYARNPLGKGHDEVELDGVPVRWLPNVEAPHQRVDSPRRAVEPASFMPMDISWPQRQALAGTYDEAWLEQLFPGYARDIDWEMFNVAQPDQRIDRALQGGDPYLFENMHPSKPLLRGLLPKFSCRAFVTRKPLATEDGPGPLTEIGLSLQTLWAFPDAERMVLVFSGSIRVSEEDGSDVSNLILAAERMGQQRELEHYAGVLKARLDPETGALASLSDDPLIPEGLAGVEEPEFAEDRELGRTEGLLQENLFRRAQREFEKSRAFVASFGLDPDVHGPPMPTPPAPPPKPEELPAIVAQLQVDAEAQRVSEQARLDQRTKEIGEMVDSLGIEGFDSKVLAAEREQTPVGPPSFTAVGQRELLAGIAADSRAKGTVIDEIEEMIVDEQLFARWADAEQRLREAYRLTAHMQTPAPPMDIERREACQARVREAIAKRESFASLNLTGADLAGMDLRGADMSGAFLESARLDGADLSGATLSAAVLAHASLREVKLEGAKLDKANLGKATLEHCVLVGAMLDESIFVEAQLSHTSLARASLIKADLSKASFAACSAREVAARGLNFIQASLMGLDLAGADLSGSNFLEVVFDGVELSGAKLEACTFYKCSARAAKLLGAQLDNARFVEGCVLDDAVLTQAVLTNAHLRGSSMQRVDLRRAQLDNSDLSECDLREAKLYQAVARGTRFEQSELAGAELMSANLMYASLARARIHGVDLRGANLYGADMARVRTDEHVQLDEAMLVKVRVNPRYDPASDPDAAGPGPGGEQHG